MPCTEVSVPFLLQRDMESPLLHRADDVLLQPKGGGTEDPHHMHTMEMSVRVLQLRGQAGQSVSPAEELQHKLKLCKSFTVD